MSIKIKEPRKVGTNILGAPILHKRNAISAPFQIVTERYCYDQMGSADALEGHTMHF